MKRILLTTGLFAIGFSLVLLIACEDTVEPVDLDGLTALSIRPYQDTLFMSTTSEPYDLSLKGSFVREYENIVSMSGVMETSTFAFVSYDSTTRDVPNLQADWFSSDPAVASVSGGRVTPRSEGVARVYAEANGIVSTSMQIKVKDPLYAPSLSLDRPLTQVVFTSIGNVSGFVQDGATLSIGDEQLGYTKEGRFTHTVGGLSEGTNAVLVKAMNATDTTLFSSQTKTFYYYPLGHDAENPENSIVGEWEGMLEGAYPFDFTITAAESPGSFDIRGVVSVNVPGMFYVEGISIEGTIDETGFIDTRLTKTTDSYEVEGTFSGIFSTLGSAEGSFAANLKKDGFPAITAAGGWTAEKK